MVFLSLIFVILAAIADAIRDTLFGHFETSIFKNWDAKFWNAFISWKYNKKIIFGYRIDGWHIFKSIYLILMFLAIVFYIPLIKLDNIILEYVANFLLLGMTHNLIFNLFYDKILNRV